MGRSKSFDASGDGYGRGEGFVTAILQQIDLVRGPSRAARTILGSAVNHAGRSGGLTAPNGPAQAALIKRALVSGRVESSSVLQLSVHGTGTPLGDPIEVGALAQVFQGHLSSVATVRTLVSNKSCYGHTEGAAGLTGLLLSACLVEKCSAPGIMHLRNVNPYVQAALSDWNSRGRSVAFVPRENATAAGTGGISGSSSFGMSGVNAHMLLSCPLDFADPCHPQVGVCTCPHISGLHLRWECSAFPDSLNRVN